MEVGTFISNFKKAFGETAELPVVFWYSDTPVGDATEKINGCLFKEFETLRKGTPISLTLDIIGCIGGKLYTGFSEMNERIPNFVSLKERYKETPKMVLDFIDKLGISLLDKKYLNLAPINKIDSFQDIIGIIFFATPDILSGLTAWAFFDNNSEDAVITKFGSGCSSVFAETAGENARNGRRTFLGFFDPSARRYVESDILSFAIPMSRFKEMYDTMPQSCLFNTPAWARVRDRINSMPQAT